MDIKNSKIELSESTTKSLAASSERFLGYFYAGLLVLGLLTFERSDISAKIASSIGPILTLMIFFALGILIFSVYSKFIGEFFLYPLQHLIHVLLDFVSKRYGIRQTSTVGILRHMGVPWIRTRSAYEFIKEFHFKREEKKSIHHCHGELHALYITAVLFFITFFILLTCQHKHNAIYPIIGSISLFAALILDTRQHSHEAFLLKNQFDEVRTLLLENGYANPCQNMEPTVKMPID